MKLFARHVIGLLILIGVVLMLVIWVTRSSSPKLSVATAQERQDLGWDSDEFTVWIYQRSPQLLHGQVFQQTEESGGPNNPFYALFIDGHWKHIWTGPEISCAAVDQYQIPSDWYDGCYGDNLTTIREGTFDERSYRPR